MIKRLQHRLGDNKGMTILMALFAFLVAAMVAAVILAAAMSSMRQAKDNQQHQQDMLILQSAGQLIEREMLNTKVTIQDVTTYENGSEKTKKRTVSTASSTLFASQVGDAVQKMYPLGTDTPTTDFTSGTSTITVAAGNFKQDVDVSFVYKTPAGSTTSSEADRSAHLIFTLTTKGSNADSSHSLIVDFNPPKETTPSTVEDKNYKGDVTKSTTTKTLSWSTPNYKRVGGDK